MTLVKPLRTFSFLNNLASSLVSPFVSFFTASNGITGILLAITTSASTTFPGIAQFVLANFLVKAKKSVILGSTFIGLLWIILGVTQLYDWFLVLIYALVNVFLGIMEFGWLLILDKVSETRRGRILATFNFYSTIGGLIATFVTGFIVGDKLYLMRYFFILSGTLYLINAYVISNSDVDASYVSTRKIKINDEVKKFLIISFVFTFIWATAWPLFPLAQVYKYHMNEFNIATIDVIGGISTLIMTRYVGVLVDKFRKKIMLLGRMALATFPLAYALSPSINYIYIAYVMSGFTNSASISYTAYLFDNSSYEEKRISIALYNMMNGIAALLGSSTASLVYEFVSEQIGVVMAIDLMMLSIAVLRVLTSLLYLKVKERVK